MPTTEGGLKRTPALDRAAHQSERMSLTTVGEPPGPVRFFLMCARLGCGARAVLDLVVPDQPPDIGTDLFGHLLHSAKAATPHITDMGWTYYQGDGYWCPRCSTPRSQRPQRGHTRSS